MSAATRFARVTLAGAVLALAAAANGTTGPAPADAAHAQIVRGTELYESTCAVCHGTGFAGGPGAPVLTGPAFQFGWKDKPAAELFAMIKTAMPPGQEGSLSDQQYADVIAAILAANHANTTGPIPTDDAALKSITIAF